MYSTSATRRFFHSIGRALMAAAVVGLFVAAPAPAAAQTPVTVTAGIDIPSLYYFRGFRQETSPKLTMWPWIDVGAPLVSEGEGAIKSATLNVGLWNSLHTGSNKDDFDGAFYEADIYATLGLGLEQVALGITYTGYTYPAPDFEAIHEILFKVSVPHMLAPYGLIAYEFIDCDGCDKGTYAEIGVGPSWPLSEEEGAATLTVPVKLGLGLKDYYDDGAAFGFFSVGGTVAKALTEKVSVKGGAEVLMLGEGAEGFNVNDQGETSKAGFVVFGGLGFTF